MSEGATARRRVFGIDIGPSGGLPIGTAAGCRAAVGDRDVPDETCAACGGTVRCGEAMIGNFEHFICVDTYPDLAAWAAAKDALDSDVGTKLDELVMEVSECSENRLWKLTDTK